MTLRAAAAVALVGTLGWIGLVWLGLLLFSTDPRSAGFDLEVLLRAGREVAAGRSPYDQSILTGAAPVAERLFYSYPPPVAQALSAVAAVPSWLMLIAWDVAAVAGLAVIVAMMARRIAPGRRATHASFIALAVAPLVFPFAVGLLFGNLDVFFPLAFGLMALSGLGPTSGGRSGDAPSAWAGIGLATSSLAKVHPLLMGAWFLTRSFRSPGMWRSVAAAALAGAAIVAFSLLIGGVGPWIDYLDLLLIRSGSGADLVDPRNAAPATQLALILTGESGALPIAQTLQVPITAGAVVATLVAAWRVRDPLVGLTIAAAASLVVLPVTWYHYPAALIPFAAAAVLRSSGGHVGGRVLGLVATAGVVAALAVAWLPLLWVAVGLVIAASQASRPAST